MRRGVSTAVAAMLMALGCARSLGPPPPAGMPRTIAVLPPSNRTGDPLVVSGTSLLETYALGSARVTVPDVLASEARLELADRGFTVVPANLVEAATGGIVPGGPEAAAALAARGGLPGLALYLDVRRWEADAPSHPTFIIVAISASLVDPASGRVVWTNQRRAAPVATPGEVNVGAAHMTAAHKVVLELLAPLGP